MSRHTRGLSMSERALGNSGPQGLDRPPFSPTPSAVSSIVAQSPNQHLVHVESDNDLQSRWTSAQERDERKAKLDKAFAAVNLNTAAVPSQSAASHPGLQVPEPSRSPQEDSAPPFQYKSSPRPEGYHIASFGSGISPYLPPGASFSKEAKPFDQNTQQLDLIKPLPLLPGQESPFQSSKTSSAAPPRPPRQPGDYFDFDRILPLEFRSTASPFVLPFGLGPSAGQVYEHSSLSPSQTSRGKPLLFDEARSSSSPQLVPPHEPGRYNPLKNPYVSKQKVSRPKPTKNTGFFERALRKFSDRKASDQQSPRAVSPVSRNRSATSPFPRPRAPTPSRGRNVSNLHPDFSSQNTGEAFSHKPRENALLLNKPAEYQPLFSIAEDGAVIFNGDIQENEWEIRALKKHQIQSNRAFNCSDFGFQDLGECKLSPNQHQSTLQEFWDAPASQFASTGVSRDFSRPAITQPQGLGIYPNSGRPFSFELPTSRTRQTSAEILVATPVENVVWRDLETGYWSQTPRHPNPHGDTGASRNLDSTGEVTTWEEIPLSDRAKSRSKPLTNSFVVGNPEAVYNQITPQQQSEFSHKQNVPRLRGEIDLSKSYPESVVGHRSSRDRLQGRVEVRSDVTSGQVLAPAATNRDAYAATYYQLFDSKPTESVYDLWTVRDLDANAEEEAGDFRGLESGKTVDVHSFPFRERTWQGSPSRGRGRTRERQFVPEEYIPEAEECPTVKRKGHQARIKAARDRQRGRIEPPLNREGPGECVTDNFLAEYREIDSPRSLRPTAPVIEEAGKSVGSPGTLSTVRRGVVERRQPLVVSPVEAGAIGKKPYFETVLQSSTPLKQDVVESTSRVEVRSDSSVKNLVARFDCAQPTQKRIASHLIRQRELSSVFRDEDLIVCVRSKTGTVKELPVTPENKLKIKTVLQEGGGYTPSVYSGDEARSPPPPAAEVCVSPLIFRRGPTPPRSEWVSPKFPFPGNVDPFRTANAFLDTFSVPEDPSLSKMDTLQVSSALRSSAKTKAEEDARAMQKSVIESCKKAGRDPPKYVLMELIGKGSFGRVYKGKDINTTQIVAVKIIDIDESDTLNPRLADSYSEFMKEVNALKILSESKARNINHVIEALPVGTAMWMITEHCGGGSVATLMKPNPDGLKEKFIIPILREVAEAVKWVHQAGIIHRDLKCANILITEEGGVQLCDFGVAGITETALDKRSTFIGTFHWMAPELFRGSSYGKEVDIWAFGSMTYEMATGLPPNAMSGVSGMDLGTYLQTHIPRLEGDSYSEGLKSIVAFCLEENPNDRPAIEDVQRHNYIHNTGAKYPSSGLSDLVKAFKLWESHGGTRKSLFAVGGAQGPSELSSTALSDDNWNFSTTPAFDLAVAQAANQEDIINVYGARVALSTDFGDETSRPNRQQQARPNRRRPPPEALAPLKAPLEKLFDPNTMSNYKDNSVQHFNLQPNAASDLPLRDDSAQTSIRDTLIDLDAHDIPSGLSSFTDMDTMKPSKRSTHDEFEDNYESGNDFARPSLSDPVDNPNRRTQDWKFPSMAPPASANPELNRFPPLQRPNVTPASGARPALVHHPTEPISLQSQGSYSLVPPSASASDRMSLIDLDMSIPEPSRPSTADSAASQDNASANPFMWERHASIYNAQGHRSAREPSLYLDDSSMGLQSRTGNTLQELTEVSDFSASDAEGYPDDSYNGYRARHEDQANENYYEPLDTSNMQGGHENVTGSNRGAWNELNSSSAAHSAALFHPLPAPPSAAVLSGTASQAEMHAESHRLFETLKSSLETFREAYENMPTRPPKNNQNPSGDEAGGPSSMYDTGSNIS